MKNFNFLLVGALLVIGAGLFFFFGNFLGFTGLIVVELIIAVAIAFLLVRFFQGRKK